MAVQGSGFPLFLCEAVMSAQMRDAVGGVWPYVELRLLLLVVVEACRQDKRIRSNLKEKQSANNPVTGQTDTFHAARGLQAEDKEGDRVGTILEHVVVR